MRLKDHMKRTHDNKRRHICTICSKAFKGKWAQKRQEVLNHPDIGTHSICHSCNRRFAKEIADLHIAECSVRDDKILNLRFVWTLGCNEPTDGFHFNCAKHQGNLAFPLYATAVKKVSIGPVLRR